MEKNIKTTLYLGLDLIQLIDILLKEQIYLRISYR